MEQFRNALITKYYRNADGIILVYDITKKETFLHLDHWVGEVKSYIGLRKVTMALIGNKLDQAANREVSAEEGQAFADRYGMTFYELSAKDQKQLTKLEEIFSMLAHDMFEMREKTDFTQSLSGVIRLGQSTEQDDWVMVSPPEGPIPRSTYAAQEVKVRLRSFLPRRRQGSGGRARHLQRQNSRGICSCL